MQVFLFEEQAEEEPVEPGEQVPVEEPQVVADGVRPEVGELDPLALALAEPLALHAADEDLLRDQFELLEPAEELRRQERGVGGGTVGAVDMGLRYHKAHSIATSSTGGSSVLRRRSARRAISHAVGPSTRAVPTSVQRRTPSTPSDRLERHHHHHLRQPDHRHLRRRPGRTPASGTPVRPSPSPDPEQLRPEHAGSASTLGSRSPGRTTKNATRQKSVATAEKWTTTAERGDALEPVQPEHGDGGEQRRGQRRASAASGSPLEVRLLRSAPRRRRRQRPRRQTPSVGRSPPAATTAAPPRSGTCS